MGDFAKEGFCWANKSAKVECNLSHLVLNFRKSRFPEFLTPFKTDDEGYWCFDSRLHYEDGEYPIVIFSKLEKVIRPEWTNFIDWLDATMDENY